MKYHELPILLLPLQLCWIQKKSYHHHVQLWESAIMKLNYL